MEKKTNAPNIPLMVAHAPRAAIRTQLINHRGAW